MKEATGELSTTVITVVAIGLIATLFAVFLYPTLRNQIILNQACNNGPGFAGKSGENGYIECDEAPTGQTYQCRYCENSENGCSAGNQDASKTCGEQSSN